MYTDLRAESQRQRQREKESTTGNEIETDTGMWGRKQKRATHRQGERDGKTMDRQVGGGDGEPDRESQQEADWGL